MQLSTYPGDFRAFKVLIAAQLTGVAVEVNEVDPKADGADPNSVPVLTSSQGTLRQSNAIARFIARSRPEAGLFGSSFFQSGEVDQWIEWGTNNVELPAIMSTHWQFGWEQFNFQANKKALDDLKAAFANLEAHLLSRTYLVGQRLSLADVIVAAQLFYPLKMSLDGAFRAGFPATLRWFSQVTSLPAVAKVVGAVVFCQKTPAPPKGQKKAKKQKGGEGGGKKKQQQQQQQPKAKKAPKPKNPLDALPKSSFVLDEWKRQYSNATSDYFKSMEWFWPEFDKAADGWSLWLQSFNHNDENTVDFVVCNKLEGYVQRTVGIQKYAFGVMQMLDSKADKGYFTVSGIWLIRGQDIQPMIDTNPESGVYTWTKLDASDEATRKRVAQYWCGEKDIDGYDCYDAKVFK